MKFSISQELVDKKIVQPICQIPDVPLESPPRQHIQSSDNGWVQVFSFRLNL